MQKASQPLKHFTDQSESLIDGWGVYHLIQKQMCCVFTLRNTVLLTFMFLVLLHLQNILLQVLMTWLRVLMQVNLTWQKCWYCAILQNRNNHLCDVPWSGYVTIMQCLLLHPQPFHTQNNMTSWCILVPALSRLVLVLCSCSIQKLMCNKLSVSPLWCYYISWCPWLHPKLFHLQNTVGRYATISPNVQVILLFLVETAEPCPTEYVHPTGKSGMSLAFNNRHVVTLVFF